MAWKGESSEAMDRPEECLFVVVYLDGVVGGGALIPVKDFGAVAGSAVVGRKQRAVGEKREAELVRVAVAEKAAVVKCKHDSVVSQGAEAEVGKVGA